MIILNILSKSISELSIFKWSNQNLQKLRDNYLEVMKKLVLKILKLSSSIRLVWDSPVQYSSIYNVSFFIYSNSKVKDPTPQRNLVRKRGSGYNHFCLPCFHQISNNASFIMHLLLAQGLYIYYPSNHTFPPFNGKESLGVAECTLQDGSNNISQPLCSYAMWLCRPEGGVVVPWPTENGGSESVLGTIGETFSWPGSFHILPLGNQLPHKKKAPWDCHAVTSSSCKKRPWRVSGHVCSKRIQGLLNAPEVQVKKPSWKKILQVQPPKPMSSQILPHFLTYKIMCKIKKAVVSHLDLGIVCCTATDNCNTVPWNPHLWKGLRSEE